MTAQAGVNVTGSILDRIVADKRTVLDRQMAAEPEAELRRRFEAYDAQWPLSRSIASPRGRAKGASRVQLIAEIKKASPSKGIIAPDLDLRRVAKAYTDGGAAGISVLTETNYFLGSLEWMQETRKLLAEHAPDARPSILRKDFVVEPYELVQARAYGADNVLLIVALLDASRLRDLIAVARALDVEALVEVHNEAEAERAMAAGGELFGVNNRDLHTFNVDLATTERIRPLLPPNATVVGESGVHTRADVERLYAAGVGAILVGEAFMTAPDVAAKMRELMI